MLWYGRRRPVGAPLSWGEAIAAATLVFGLMFWSYGVVPHQWLQWANNELQWTPTRKLWTADQGFASAVKACDASLAKLKLDYIDLYLIHWPEPGKRLDSWRALVELRKQGKCRSIGVSNYTVAPSRHASMS